VGLAFLITSEKLQLLSERKVLKESEYASLLDAAAVTESSNEEARRILREAQAQAEEMRRRGYEAGRAEARAEYAQRLLAVAEDSQAELRGLRDVMAQLVVKAVAQFAAEAEPARLFETALSRVDHLLRREPFVSIRVAPSEEAALRAVIDRLRESNAWSLGVVVQPDPQLARGSCVLQTPSGTLEIGIDAQIEALRRAVARAGT
jgi:type III secretion protein L